MSYVCRKLDRFAESGFLGRLYLSAQVRFFMNFHHDLSTLNTKCSVNELIFPLVTHMVNSDAWFDSYWVLKTGQGAEQILDRLDLQTNDQVLRA
jgi:hypothetical protein